MPYERYWPSISHTASMSPPMTRMFRDREHQRTMQNIFHKTSGDWGLCP